MDVSYASHHPLFGVCTTPRVMIGPNSLYSDLEGNAHPVDVISDPKQIPHPQTTLSKKRMMNFRISLLKLIHL